MTFDETFQAVLATGSNLDIDIIVLHQAKSLFELAYLLGKSEGLSELMSQV